MALAATYEEQCHSERSEAESKDPDAEPNNTTTGLKAWFLPRKAFGAALQP
jgi:hypothetical protein